MSSTDTDVSQIRTLVIGCLVAVGCLLGAREGHAQFDQRPLAIGDLHMVYTATGGQQEYYNQGPNHLQLNPEFQDGLLRADALWIGAKNVQGADGEEYSRRVVHIGPRTTGFGEYFPVGFRKVVRYEPTEVLVDGNVTLKEDKDFDEVDNSLPADQMIEVRAHTLLGVTLTKRIYAWSQDAHDNYHVQEYVLENTGHVSAQEEGELEGQTVEDVYLHFQKRYTHQERSAIPGQEWGANVMNDVVGDGQEDYEVDFKAQYTWNGNSPGAEMDPLGGPAWNDDPSFFENGDDQGELTTTQFVGTVKLYAPESPDKPRQPSMTGHIDADDPITSGNSPFSTDQMQEEYQFMSKAILGRANTPRGEGTHMYPHHADIADQDGDFTTVMGEGDPKLGKAGGYTSAFSYGPYDLEPGESVRIVIAEGVAGLSPEARVKIGQAFKATANGGDRGATDAFAPIEYDADHDGTIGSDERMGKNEWVMTGRDSLFQTFERALANFEESSNGSGALANYGIPQAPRPPSRFEVSSGVDQIQLAWERGSDPPNGFEIYRGRSRVVGQYEREYQYEKIATLDGSAREYSDDDVVRGAQYFYYIQAVGPENQDPTAMTPVGQPLKSSRSYTQTYDPASLKRGPGSVDEFKIVPNPYNIAADQNVRWDQQDRLGFLEIPGNCVIRIYTEMGELVETIRHEDGSGDEFWDHTTADRQLVVSGLYIAVVENLDTGAVSKKKFVIVR